MIDRLLVLGATGDLAGRYLLPALAGLVATGRLGDGLRVVGAGADDLDDDGFRRRTAERLDRHAADVPHGARDVLLRSLRYERVDLGRPAAAAIGAAVEHLAGPSGSPGAVGAYLALPPRLFPGAVATLAATGLPAGSRVAVEKPFGHDLGSAAALDARLAGLAATLDDERAAYRVDHYLALDTVQDLRRLRSPGGVLEPGWSGTQVASVDIRWEETLALEGRAAYYDGSGALRDMVQNHLLQVLTLLAMEPPGPGGSAPGPTAAQRKVEVLRALRLAGPPAESTRRARYAAGSAGGQPVPGYAEEDGVDPARGTETFAEVVVEVDRPRWAGTRFRLRTGKALERTRQEVTVGLRAAPHLPLTLPLGAPERPAYERILLDLLSGGSELSVSGPETAEAWRAVAPVLDAWRTGEVPLADYPAGSAGPPPLDDRPGDAG